MKKKNKKLIKYNKKNILKKKKSLVFNKKLYLVKYKKDFRFNNILVFFFLTAMLKSGKFYRLQKIFYKNLINLKDFKINYITFFYYILMKLKFPWLLKNRWRYIKKKKVFFFKKATQINYLRTQKIIFSYFKKNLIKEKKHLIFHQFLLRELLLFLYQPQESKIIKLIENNNKIVYSYYKKFYRYKNKFKHYRWT
jgi:hypothetical protein